jgi:hypothetical protein
MLSFSPATPKKLSNKITDFYESWYERHATRDNSTLLTYLLTYSVALVRN